MGFNSAFKGLKMEDTVGVTLLNPAQQPKNCKYFSLLVTASYEGFLLLLEITLLCLGLKF
jgi:hypothetical protein